MDSEELLDELRKGNALTMAESRYVLIEFLPNVSYSRLYQRLRQLQAAGYLHCGSRRAVWLPERRGKDRGSDRSGSLIQMNYRSLTGNILNKNTRWCRRQILQGNVHLLGTDMHNTGARRPGQEKRWPGWSVIDPKKELHRLVKRNPEYILNKKEGIVR